MHFEEQDQPRESWENLLIFKKTKKEKNNLSVEE